MTCNKHHGFVAQRRKLRINCFVLPALLMTAAFHSAQPLDAALIYSNLGPNDSFFTSPGTYPVWNLTSGGFIHRAASFTVPGSQDVQFGSADLGSTYSRARTRRT